MRVITGILAVLALMLSGCSDTADPDVLPEPTGSEVATPRPSPTPAASPTQSATPVDEALQFVDDYLWTANEALTDAAALKNWRSYFSDSCSVCLSGFRAASSIRSQGNSVEDGKFRDWRATKQASDSTQVTVLVIGDVDAATVRSPDGDVVSTFDSVESATVLYTMRKQPDGSWLMIAGELVG
ncbi:MAG: hypothetical protein WCA82_04220 [Jiangellales bacterium]